MGDLGLYEVGFTLVVSLSQEMKSIVSKDMQGDLKNRFCSMILGWRVRIQLIAAQKTISDQKVKGHFVKGFLLS